MELRRVQDSLDSMIIRASWRRQSIPRVAHILSALIALGTPAVFASDGVPDTRIELYRDALAAELPPAPRAALARIDGTARQLLALRSYLKAGKSIDTRWSWSQKQIDAFAETPEYRELLEEVQQIKNSFEAQNAGFTLYANTQVRSLDVQIERWNRNGSVEAAAEALDTAVRQQLGKKEYPSAPDVTATARFAKYLRSWHPPGAVALAAPGLSKHGQLRAIDFAIFREGKLVAPTDLASAVPVWERQGWSERLKRATEATSFVGPLKYPNEPWHYEYVPAKASIRVAEDCERAPNGPRC